MFDYLGFSKNITSSELTIVWLRQGTSLTQANTASRSMI